MSDEEVRRVLAVLSRVLLQPHAIIRYRSTSTSFVFPLQGCWLEGLFKCPPRHTDVE